MKRQLLRLSQKEVVNKRVPGYYPDGGGLYLQVSEAGTKSWLFRFVLNGGKERQMGLGPLHTVTLAEARAAAVECRKLLLAKIDPIAARKARQAGQALDAARTITFAECATAYIKAHNAGWKSAKHAEQWTNTIETYCGPVFGALPVQGVDTGLVLKVLEPIWTAKNETATRLRGRIESVLDWATSRGYRTGDNPARWRGHIENLLPAISKRRRVKHHPALPYDELGQFIAALRTQEGTAARALEFTILTAARTGEVIGAQWDEIDLEGALWTIPAARMKAHIEHRVPLSPAAVTLLRTLHEARQGDCVFHGQKAGKPISHWTMLQVLKRMGRGDVTIHGFRSTFRDWTSERTSYPRDVCEMALAHTVGDQVEAAYRRGDLFEKRARLMAEWATHCENTKRAGADVIPLQGAAA